MKNLTDYKKEFEEACYKDWVGGGLIDPDGYPDNEKYWQFIENMAKSIVKDSVPSVFEINIQKPETKSSFSEVITQIMEQLRTRQSHILGEDNGQETNK